MLQVNFITGGLALTFVSHHQAMDMTGQGHMMHLLSKACHGEPFTDDEVSSGNLDRRTVVPLLDGSYKPGPELAHQMVGPPSKPVSQGEPPRSSWAYFTFHPTSLAALKSLASASNKVPSGYISTDDALSAFIWQSVMRARLPRLDLTAKSTLARAVDPRRYLGIPHTYPGLVQNMTYHTHTLRELAGLSLSEVASELRSAVDPQTSNLAYNTSALATLLSHAKDKNTVSVTAAIDLSVDIMISSWAKPNCYHLDFNLGLGKPEAVRRPRFDPVESLIYFMPRRLDNEIAVASTLSSNF
ncbi:transferase [Diplogelasinospora grovesii]|uniref:Transferase n=1 Tax=Diplogelasinospora grovesii TaxID=303347 RepID=A0AAN6S181_9PEZI|nr:transferase [Diplogelasinospora grovesii]